MENLRIFDFVKIVDTNTDLDGQIGMILGFPDPMQVIFKFSSVRPYGRDPAILLPLYCLERHAV